MKLLELLVQEKVQWPAGALWAMQDSDHILKFTETLAQPSAVYSGTWIRSGFRFFECLSCDTQADDWETKVVSKSEYDAAVAKEAWESVVKDVPSSTLQWYIDLAPVIAAAAEGKVVQYLAADSNWYTNQGTFMHPSKYRVKPEEPKTIKVNGFDVPEPMREAPARCTAYYLTCPTDSEYYNYVRWSSGDLQERHWLSRGLLHSTKEAAVAHAKAMLGIDPYADEGADDEHA